MGLGCPVILGDRAAKAGKPIEQVKCVAECAIERTHVDRIVLTETGSVLDTHVGSGAVGIAWLTSTQ
jgi:fatty acid-binding protein DegV